MPRSRYPVIDIHTHLSFAARTENGVGIGEEMKYLAPVDALLPLMDRKNIRVMVNLTGGVGKGLEETIRKFQRPYPERFVVFTEPWWERTNQPGYSKFQADEIVRAHHAGARGLKILKTLGLFLREGISKGPLVKIDDPRFDAMWEACGSLGMPVAIHVSDPEAFFLPIDRFNERFEELNNHPDWSFYGGDFPSNRELLEARNRVLVRHPKTQFIVLHVGNDAENLPYVGDCMDRLPNMYVELGARIGELGRQPRMARKFFEKYQDRILFGTDAVPHGTDMERTPLNKFLLMNFTRFITAFLKPKTNISITPLHRCLRRDVGAFTVLGYPTEYSRRSIMKMLPGSCESRSSRPSKRLTKQELSAKKKAKQQERKQRKGIDDLFSSSICRCRAADD